MVLIMIIASNAPRIIARSAAGDRIVVGPRDVVERLWAVVVRRRKDGCQVIERPTAQLTKRSVAG